MSEIELHPSAERAIARLTKPASAWSPDPAQQFLIEIEAWLGHWLEDRAAGLMPTERSLTEMRKKAHALRMLAHLEGQR